MCGSGAATGNEITAVIRRPTPRVLQTASTGCCAVAVGTTMRRTAACRVGSATIPTFVATTAASGWLSFLNLRTDFLFFRSKLRWERRGTKYARSERSERGHTESPCARDRKSRTARKDMMRKERICSMRYLPFRFWVAVRIRNIRSDSSPPQCDVGRPATCRPCNGHPDRIT